MESLDEQKIEKIDTETPHQNIALEFDLIPEPTVVAQSIFEHASSQPNGRVIDVTITVLGRGRVQGSIKCGNVTLDACRAWAQEQVANLAKLA